MLVTSKMKAEPIVAVALLKLVNYRMSRKCYFAISIDLRTLSNRFCLILPGLVIISQELVLVGILTTVSRLTAPIVARPTLVCRVVFRGKSLV